MAARLGLLAALLALLAAAPPAHAAPRYAGAAVATITSCKGDGFSASASVRSVSARTRRPARVRGARLQLRLDAVPLFGLPRPGQWRDLGSRSSGLVSESFSALPFDTWAAVVRYRYRRGRRTVLAGDQRSESKRVGRRRGRAFCILPEGAKPRDTRAPALFIDPADDRWRRAPLSVRVTATDDFSGVAEVLYRVNGGDWQTIRNGTTFDLTTEGSHAVEVTARDAAGNWAPARAQTFRADGGAPTAPSLSLPRSVTADSTPPISWGASSDSGSGVRGYLVAVKRPDGSTAAQALVGPETTSIDTPSALAEGTYTAEVKAFDGTDPAWEAAGTRAFTVDFSPSVTDVDPDDGAVFAEDSTPTFTLRLDRPANPASIADSVFLDRHPESGSDPAVSAVCGNDACTAITVTPASPLDEGRYALRVTDGLRSDENTAFTPFNAAYSVQFFADDSFGGNCVLGLTTPARQLSTTDDAEDATFAFTASGTWKVDVLVGTASIATNSGGAGAGSVTFAMPNTDGQPPASISFRFTNCGSSFTATNLRAWRHPRTSTFP